MKELIADQGHAQDLGVHVGGRDPGHMVEDDLHLGAGVLLATDADHHHLVAEAFPAHTGGLLQDAGHHHLGVITAGRLVVC